MIEVVLINTETKEVIVQEITQTVFETIKAVINDEHSELLECTRCGGDHSWCQNVSNDEF